MTRERDAEQEEEEEERKERDGRERLIELVSIQKVGMGRSD